MFVVVLVLASHHKRVCKAGPAIVFPVVVAPMTAAQTGTGREEDVATEFAQQHPGAFGHEQDKFEFAIVALNLCLFVVIIGHCGC